MPVSTNMVMPNIERVAVARNYGKFVISPLESGYGITVGNALRRVLLSSLDGVAVTSIRITDVPHEFSNIEGVRDVQVQDNTLTCTVAGEIDTLIKTAAQYHVVNMISHEPSMEEIFLAYYNREDDSAA